VPTSKQRRDAARRHLERQLQRRQEREASRRRMTLIASIAGTVVLVAGIVGVILVVGGNDKKKTTAADNPTVSSPTASPTPSVTPSKSRAAKGTSVTFQKVTIKGAADLGGYPSVTSKATTPATKLTYQDLVVGTGKAAAATDTVSVQYVGVLYNNGKKFDSSWDRGTPAQFSLAQVVKGFTYGISGTSGVPPMKVGGRRVMILPPSLGYGTRANQTIPANSSLVFVVDLKSISNN
jgi:FKBP-type peptidyl-prolyl cis-trans isomerase